jgi:hypothetical protein
VELLLRVVDEFMGRLSRTRSSSHVGSWLMVYFASARRPCRRSKVRWKLCTRCSGDVHHPEWTIDRRFVQ